MEKIIIFGTGSGGLETYTRYKDTHHVLSFTSNDTKYMGGGTFCNIAVIPPVKIPSATFDYIVIGSEHYDEIFQQLTQELDIPATKIKNGVSMPHIQVRITALKNISHELNRRQVAGAVAELGVYRGEFAKHINELFPERTLHLFDTFEGFSEDDIAKEKELLHGMDASEYDFIRAGHLGDTSVEEVLAKMPHPQICKVHKGYFPDTTMGIEDDTRFCFVSIDVDLYQPALAGLRFFYEKLVPTGVIILHDYYATGYLNVKKAFDKFLSEYPSARYVAIGDDVSIAVVK